MAPVTRQMKWIGAALVLLVLGAGAAWYTLRGRDGAAPPASETTAATWTCPMHPHVQEHGPGPCPECGMDLVPAAGAGDPAAASADQGTPRAGITIDPRRQQLIGVRTTPVERKTMTSTVRAAGIVRYDETRLTDVNLKLEGWIRTLHVETTGALVRRGQPLFTLYSPELVATQNEYLLALKTRDQLAQSQLPDAREHAERLVESARARLALWDLAPDQFAKLDASRQADPAILFRSPAAGYVIEKHAIEGQHVMPGQTLYKLADLSTVWIEADVYEQDIRRLRVGAPATVTLDAYPGERFAGKVSFIYPFVGDETRTVKVRVTLANRGARLKPGMYAGVELPASGGEQPRRPGQRASRLRAGADRLRRAGGRLLRTPPRLGRPAA